MVKIEFKVPQRVARKGDEMQVKSNTQGKRLHRGRYLLGVIFMLMVWIVAFPQETDAAVLGKDIREGDLIALEAGNWSQNYAVLSPDTTNIGTEGTFLMMDGFKEKIMHDETGRSNLWAGSTSQQWCTNYYRKLTDSVSSKIIGVKTTDTESGSQWLVVSNIDGTKTDKDKVFFLSGKEYLEHTEAADHSKGYNWLLRSPGSDCSVYADYIGVACNGSIHNFSIEHVMAARPAFNIRLPHDVCVKAQTEENGTRVWTIDAEAMEHQQDDATYTWSKDGKACRAEAQCSRCGDVVRESGEVKSQLIKEPSEKTDGIIRYTATFKNSAFREQTTELPLAWEDFKDDTEEPLEPEKPVIKPGSEVQVGDYVYMGEKNPKGYSGMPYWKVMGKEKDGTVLLMSEYLWRGNGNEAVTPPAFNLHRSDGNEWQSSVAQRWCKSFEAAVLADVDGLEIKETTKSDKHIQSPDDPLIQYSARENILNKEKVYFLSAEEVLKYMPTRGARVAYISDGKKTGKADSWWLRSPRYQSEICSGRVSSEGKMLKHYVDELSAARPVFRANIDKMNFEVQGTKDDRVVLAAEKSGMEHSFENAKYEWSSDMKQCHAGGVCTTCGAKAEADAEVTSRLTENGTKYIARFRNPNFKTQVKVIADAKPKPADKALKTGGKYTVSGAVYKVSSAKSRTVILVKAKNAKSVSVPATVKISGKSCKVIQVAAKSLTGSKIRKVTVGKNVKKLEKYAFAKSKATTVVLQSKFLKKSTVKGCFKSSKVKTVQVKVGSKKVNKKAVKAYKKIFTKKNSGKSVKVR